MAHQEAMINDGYIGKYIHIYIYIGYTKPTALFFPKGHGTESKGVASAQAQGFSTSLAQCKALCPILPIIGVLMKHLQETLTVGL